MDPNQAYSRRQEYEAQVPSLCAHQESEIIDFFLWVSLQDEILKIEPFQKKIRFNVFVAMEITRLTLNIMCFKEVITSMWSIVTLTKFSTSLCKY